MTHSKDQEFITFRYSSCKTKIDTHMNTQYEPPRRRHIHIHIGVWFLPQGGIPETKHVTHSHSPSPWIFPCPCPRPCHATSTTTSTIMVVVTLNPRADACHAVNLSLVAVVLPSSTRSTLLRLNFVVGLQRQSLRHSRRTRRRYLRKSSCHWAEQRRQHRRATSLQHQPQRRHQSRRRRP